MRPRSAVLVSLAAAAGFGFFVVGAFLYKTFIGLDASAFPAGALFQAAGRALGLEADVTIAGIAWVLALLLAVGAVTFFVVRGAVRRRVARLDPARRSFLTGAASGAGAALGATALATLAAVSRAFFGVGNQGRGWQPVGTEIFGAQVAKTHPEWREEWKGSRIRSHRRLGRTGFEVSDIVLGTGAIRGENGEKIARLAIERGINYFDTSPDYSGSGSEQAMGRAIRGVRDRLFIATKFCTPEGHLGAGSSVARYKEVVEASLSRLGTDYVDLVHIHSCDEVERLMDPNVHEAFDRLEQEGKVRFLGFSSHTPRLAEVADRAIASGRFDVMMLAYHHGIFPTLGAIIERGQREQDMGIVAMKTLKGARHHGLEGFRDESNTYAQAALKWALTNPAVSCAVISFSELQHVDEYLAASGGLLTQNDVAVLDKYDRLVRGEYCSPHCGACLSRCPEGLPIADVLRYRMYFEEYGQEKEAIRLYAKLAKDASVCAACSAPCLGSCPLDVRIPERMIGAHELLTLG